MAIILRRKGTFCPERLFFGAAPRGLELFGGALTLYGAKFFAVGALALYGGDKAFVVGALALYGGDKAFAVGALVSRYGAGARECGA